MSNKIILTKWWNGHRPGETLEPLQPDVSAQLVQRGLARYVAEDKPQDKPKKPKLIT